MSKESGYFVGRNFVVTDSVLWVLLNGENIVYFWQRGETVGGILAGILALVTASALHTNYQILRYCRVVFKRAR